jgi:hypothetical protein
MATTKIPLEEQALVAGTYKSLSNPLLFDIYGLTTLKVKKPNIKRFDRPFHPKNFVISS